MIRERIGQAALRGLPASGRSLLTHDGGRLTAELTLVGRASGKTFHVSSRVLLSAKGKL